MTGEAQDIFAPNRARSQSNTNMLSFAQGTDIDLAQPRSTPKRDTLSTRIAVPSNITIHAMPPKSPELNPDENICRPYVRCRFRLLLVHALRRARVASDGPHASGG